VVAVTDGDPGGPGAASDGGDPILRRRALLGGLAGAGTATLAGCAGLFSDDEGTGTETPTPSPTSTPVEADRARRLAERFAPVLYFDAGERWFPTDPRPYAGDDGGDRVVDGFEAFNGYVRRFEESGDPPDPTVFYHAVEYDESPLAVVQFWFYSVFDQFTTNFHWHDWEVLHVFVDTESEEPQLYVASAHSRKVPNNEHLDPSPEAVPRVLSELGSHSSALSVNRDDDGFQRLPTDDLPADITNRAVAGVEALAGLPFAYGLPRDEGARLPYLVPELDGDPVYDHPDLPDVSRSSLVPEDVTVRSYDSLSAPPDSLPPRETETVFDLAGRETPRTDPDVRYDLVPTGEVEDVDDFTGPQLSFEFAVPGFAEDAIASHITSVSTPWSQPRYEDPAADITEPDHRAALADRYAAVSGPGPLASVVAGVSRAVQSEDAPDGEGLATTATPVEAVALLQSEPSAVPTFQGVAALRDVPAGDHRLTVNGAGFAPYSETLTVGGGDEETADEDGTTTSDDTTTSDGSDTATPPDAETTTPTGTAAATPDDDGSAPGGVTAAGVDGRIALVDANEAVKLSVDAEGTDEALARVAVEDDFAGRLYDAPVEGSDAVYVHRQGAFTAEVRDADDAVGAFRVNPGEESRVTIDRPRTGKASLASFVATLARETRTEIADVVDAGGTGGDGGGSGGGSGDGGGGGSGDGGPSGAVGGLLRALEAAIGNLERAVTRAETGDAAGADRALDTARSNLERAVQRFLEAEGEIPDTLANAASRRFEQARRRARQARDSVKL
jgi:hypothetical protein